jgi:hypothetical protein
MSCQVVSIHTNVARSRIDSFAAAELHKRLSPGFCRAHAGAQVVVYVQAQVRLELSGPLALAPRFAEPAGQPNQDRAQFPHDECPPIGNSYKHRTIPMGRQ